MRASIEGRCWRPAAFSLQATSLPSTTVSLRSTTSACPVRNEASSDARSFSEHGHQDRLGEARSS
ncbi:Hypothetical protein A7982_02960 [Minicystis rosea]|nr:Hypothetical protein A7982_02960 [Minicystis rosea]